jgi:hypothetical protein
MKVLPKRAKCKHDLSLAYKGQITQAKKSCAKMRACKVMERGKLAPSPLSHLRGEINKLQTSDKPAVEGS